MIFDFFDSPELLDIQRTGFYRFLKEDIPQLLAKEFPIKVLHGNYEISICLNKNAIKLIAPEENPRDCILKMKTYNCKLYAQVKIVCKRSSGFQSDSFWEVDESIRFEESNTNQGSKDPDFCGSRASSLTQSKAFLCGSSASSLTQSKAFLCGSSASSLTKSKAFRSKKLRFSSFFFAKQKSPAKPRESHLRGAKATEVLQSKALYGAKATEVSQSKALYGAKATKVLQSEALYGAKANQKISSLKKKNDIIYESLPEWVLLGQLPMMTKRGHFIINGSPRVIVHQVVRSPGIYFQKLLKKDDQNRARFYGDIIPLKGVWIRLQMTKKGRVEAKFKKGKKVEVELLQKCLQVIESQTLLESRLSLFLGPSSKSSRFLQILPPITPKALCSKTLLIGDKNQETLPLRESAYEKLLGKKKGRAESKAEHDAFIHTYDKLYRTTQDKELEEWQKKKRNQKFFKDKEVCGSGVFKVTNQKSFCPNKSSYVQSSALESSTCASTCKQTKIQKSERNAYKYKSSICKKLCSPQFTENEAENNRSLSRIPLQKQDKKKKTDLKSDAQIEALFPKRQARNDSSQLNGNKNGVTLNGFVVDSSDSEASTFTEQNSFIYPSLSQGLSMVLKNQGLQTKNTAFSKALAPNNEKSYALEPSKQKEVESFLSKKEKMYGSLCCKKGISSRPKRAFATKKPENAFKRKRCSEALFATFKSSSRYNLGKLGRDKINNRFGLALSNRQEGFVALTNVRSFANGFSSGVYKAPLCKYHLERKPAYKNEFLDKVFTTQLTSLDLCYATIWLYRLRKGEESTDDIDHSQNRRVRTSGELLHTQFENGVYRLKNLLSTKLQEWKGDMSISTFSSLFKKSYKSRYNPKLALQSFCKKKTRTNLLTSVQSEALFAKLCSGKFVLVRSLKLGLGVTAPKTLRAKFFKNSLAVHLQCKARKSNRREESKTKSDASVVAKLRKQRVALDVRKRTSTNLLTSTYKASLCFLASYACIRFVKRFVSVGTSSTYVPLTESYGLQRLVRNFVRKDTYVNKGFLPRKKKSSKAKLFRAKSFFALKKICTCKPCLQSESVLPRVHQILRTKRSFVTTLASDLLGPERHSKISIPTIKELFSTKPITGALREFFGSNPLSQYMDQTNPLAEITHKRRLSSLGLGGVSRESAGMAIRGIHPTHYGRICPIETPEGKNAGLVNSLAFYTKVDEAGFLKTPYYRVFKGQVQASLGFSFCSAKEESATGLQIAPSDLQKSSSNVLRTKVSTLSAVPVRVADNFLDVFKKENPYNVQLIAISPIQMISVATSLIPFLEHNDANRALMGSNMQRQAVPLMISERPVVGTGLESTVIVESGHITESQISGFISHVTANQVVIDRLLQNPSPSFFENPFLWLNPYIAKEGFRTQTALLASLSQRFVKSEETKTSTHIQGEIKCKASFSKLRKQSFPLLPLSRSKSNGGVTSTNRRFVRSFVWSESNGGFAPLAEDLQSCALLEHRSENVTSKALHSPKQSLGGLSFTNLLKKKERLTPQKYSRRFSQKKDGSFLHSTTSLLTTFSRSNQNTSITEKPLLREFDWVQKGDILTDCSASNNGELAVGKNVLLAYIPWEGYNFEDAIVISDRLVREHVYTSLHIERYVFQAQDLKEGAEWFTKHLPGVKPFYIQHLEESGLPKIGSFLKEGDIIVGKIRYLAKKPSSPYERLLCDILGERNFAARNKSLYVPKGVSARVIYHKVISAFENDLENKVRPPEAAKTVHIFLGEKRVIQVGDKISGRHGNKGVISTILPRQDMPYLPDGTPIDLILNPLGVPSRMNVGQVLECLLGLAASYLNHHFKIAAFDEKYGVEASKSIVFLKLYQARLMSGQNWLFQVSFPGKTRLIDGRSGECFDQWITVGKAYILKLIHMVSEKIHARSTGPYALITQQPLRGRSNKGGQRLGEMEVWALEGFGAAYTLQELLTKKSDDFFGRKQIVDSILPNPASIIDRLEPSYRITKGRDVLGHPEIFKVLLCELQALCLDLGVYIVTPESFQRTFLGVVH